MSELLDLTAGSVRSAGTNNHSKPTIDLFRKFGLNKKRKPRKVEESLELVGPPQGVPTLYRPVPSVRLSTGRHGKLPY